MPVAGKTLGRAIETLCNRKRGIALEHLCSLLYAALIFEETEQVNAHDNPETHLGEITHTV